MVRKLRVYINPSWNAYGYDETEPLPENWDNWTEKEQHDYVEEVIQNQIEDSGGEVVEVDE